MANSQQARSHPPTGFVVHTDEISYWWEARIDGELVEGDPYARLPRAIADAWREYEARGLDRPNLFNGLDTPEERRAVARKALAEIAAWVADAGECDGMRAMGFGPFTTASELRRISERLRGDE